MTQRPREEFTYCKMRRNVRKTIKLSFTHYELRVKALISVSYQTKQIEQILPIIKLKILKRWFIREEILFELRKIEKIVDADLHIEVFGVYSQETAIGEYKRYLGELFFFMSGINEDDKTTYRYKSSHAYFEHPNKSSFIPEGVQDNG